LGVGPFFGPGPDCLERHGSSMLQTERNRAFLRRADLALQRRPHRPPLRRLVVPAVGVESPRSPLSRSPVGPPRPLRLIPAITLGRSCREREDLEPSAQCLDAGRLARSSTASVSSALARPIASRVASGSRSSRRSASRSVRESATWHCREVALEPAALELRGLDQSLGRGGELLAGLHIGEGVRDEVRERRQGRAGNGPRVVEPTTSAPRSSQSTTTDARSPAPPHGVNTFPAGRGCRRGGSCRPTDPAGRGVLVHRNAVLDRQRSTLQAATIVPWPSSNGSCRHVGVQRAAQCPP
jgi:hypothetical protein